MSAVRQASDRLDTCEFDVHHVDDAVAPATVLAFLMNPATEGNLKTICLQTVIRGCFNAALLQV